MCHANSMVQAETTAMHAGTDSHFAAAPTAASAAKAICKLLLTERIAGKPTVNYRAVVYFPEILARWSI